MSHELTLKGLHSMNAKQTFLRGKNIIRKRKGGKEGSDFSQVQWVSRLCKGLRVNGSLMGPT